MSERTLWALVLELAVIVGVLAGTAVAVILHAHGIR